MTYQETTQWMFRQLPMYQRQGKSAFKKDLTNIVAFCHQLQHPQERFKSIHVGGTNGKGSTSHMLASVLQEAGYKVGLYTSPHLKNYTERIRINGKEIPESYVVRFIQEHKSFLEAQGLSFFEMTVGMAFDYFATEKVDIAIIEVGLGGRLDSTNIIRPLISVITNIGFDHMQFLGDTLPKIAAEKAGIIKNETPVVIGERHPETQVVFTDKAKACNSPILFADDNHSELTTDLLGAYQKKNITTAHCALQQLTQFKIARKHVEQGFNHVAKNTGLRGRWEILAHKPKTICDTAHNKEGLREVMGQLTKESYRQLHMVIGVVDDKRLDDVLPLFPKKAQYYFCKPDVPRGMEVALLQKAAKDYGLLGASFVSVNDALTSARRNAQEKDVIYIGGSTFVVAEVL